MVKMTNFMLRMFHRDNMYVYLLKSSWQQQTSRPGLCITNPFYHRWPAYRLRTYTVYGLPSPRLHKRRENPILSSFVEKANWDYTNLDSSIPGKIPKQCPVQAFFAWLTQKFFLLQLAETFFSSTHSLLLSTASLSFEPAPIPSPAWGLREIPENYNASSPWVYRTKNPFHY